MSYNLVGIVIENRRTFAPDVQEILTRFGDIIKMRIGLHEDEGDNNEGFVILSLKDDDRGIGCLMEELVNIDGIRVKNIKV